MRKIMTIALLAFTMTMQAQTGQKVWQMKVAENTYLPLNSVAFLLTTDTEETFSVVAKDGTIYKGIKETDFRESDDTGIDAPTADSKTPQIVASADGTICIEGCRRGADVALYGLKGEQLSRSKTTEERAVIDISGMAAGVYVLSVDGVSVKFIKK